MTQTTGVRDRVRARVRVRVGVRVRDRVKARVSVGVRVRAISKGNMLAVNCCDGKLSIELSLVCMCLDTYTNRYSIRTPLPPPPSHPIPFISHLLFYDLLDYPFSPPPSSPPPPHPTPCLSSLISYCMPL